MFFSISIYDFFLVRIRFFGCKKLIGPKLNRFLTIGLLFHLQNVFNLKKKLLNFRFDFVK